MKSRNGDDGAADNAMERFEDLGRKLFRVAKEDVEKVEHEAEEIIEEALGPPPAPGPAIEGED
jgi:hypothetical protein